jgi:hypothetical protein
VVKVKAVSLHAKQSQRGGRGIAVLMLASGARREWVVSAVPWPIDPRKETQYPLYRRLVVTWVCSGKFFTHQCLNPKSSSLP